MSIFGSGNRKSAVVNVSRKYPTIWIRKKQDEWRKLYERDDEKNSPPYPRIYFEDISPAGVKRALSQHNGFLSHQEPEGGLLEACVRRDFPRTALNNAYDAEPMSIDRASRKPVEIPNTGMSIGISPQPSVAFEFGRNKLVRRCGLLARFMFLLCPSLAGSREIDTQPIPAESLKYLADLTEALLSMPAPGEGKHRHQLPLDYDAEQAFKEFARCAEAQLQPGGALSFDQDGWGSKLPGKVLRLAALLHCITHKGNLVDELGESRLKPIDGETMRQAIALGYAFTSHAQKYYWQVDYGITTDIAREIEAWAIRSGCANFSVEDARCALSRYSTKEIHTGVDLLRQSRRIDEDLLAYQQQQQTGRRGRNLAPRYRLVYQHGAFPV